MLCSISILIEPGTAVSEADSSDLHQVAYSCEGQTGSKKLTKLAVQIKRLEDKREELKKAPAESIAKRAQLIHRLEHSDNEFENRQAAVWNLKNELEAHRNYVVEHGARLSLGSELERPFNPQVIRESIAQGRETIRKLEGLIRKVNRTLKDLPPEQHTRIQKHRAEYKKLSEQIAVGYKQIEILDKRIAELLQRSHNISSKSRSVIGSAKRTSAVDGVEVAAPPERQGFDAHYSEMEL